MKVLTKNSWQSVPLDYAAGVNERHVYVRLMINIQKIDDAYFQRHRSWRLVLNYVREIGLANTLIKIASRSKEKFRNEKYLSIGYGSVVDHGQNRAVYFVAPFHPACVDVITCNTQLIHFSDENLDLPDNTIKHIDLHTTENGRSLLPKCEGLIGWSPFSGAPLPTIDWTAIKAEIGKSLAFAGDQLAIAPRAIQTAAAAQRPQQGAISATLFGFGNYAKTVILPNLPKDLRITRIHEVDPLQLTQDIYRNYTCDSSPSLSPSDSNQVFFIAGFHHTHTPLAIEALRRDAHVVVEKPLVTTQQQLNELLPVLKTTKGQFFACFHKRYLPFNAFVRNDLGIGAEDPINYHAIVYEVPLPLRHWYRWPNSRSRIVSNGCHWLDHFLFLNNFCKVDRRMAFCAPDGTINVTVTLENSACFSMILTDVGSERLGVQDHIELRQNGTTIKMINGGYYEAESSDRILRRTHGNRMDSYRNMYRSIGEAIVNNQSGDSAHSVEVSSSLTLAIEEQIAG